MYRCFHRDGPVSLIIPYHGGKLTGKTRREKYNGKQKGIAGKAKYEKGRIPCKIGPEDLHKVCSYTNLLSLALEVEILNIFASVSCLHK